ncbi:tRNA dimethylallyltransferase [Pelomyxa schiedti]|nr:tRNA dimethylallyltransferase [Pelomyxa schiedti]
MGENSTGPGVREDHSHHQKLPVESSKIHIRGTMHRGTVERHRVVVIVGATGTGKSKLAVHIARRVGGEIINADAMQTHRGLDVITNKPLSSEMHGVPHHLFSVVDDFAEPPPGDTSTKPPSAATTGPAKTDIMGGGSHADVRWWVGEARRLVAEIEGRGHVPIIVGGSHYYVYSLLWGELIADPDGNGNPETGTATPNRIESEISTESEAERRLKIENAEMIRAALQNLEAEKNSAKDGAGGASPLVKQQLFDVLSRVDPAMAQKWHINETRKIVRCLNFYLQNGRPYSQAAAEKRVCESKPEYEPCLLWVDCDLKELSAKLYQRVDEMIGMGAVEEVAELRKKVMSIFPESDVVKGPEGQLPPRLFELGLMQSIGAQELWESCLNPRLPSGDYSPLLEQGISEMKKNTVRYVHTQLRWIRNRLMHKSVLYRIDATCCLPSETPKQLHAWEDCVGNPAVEIVEEFLRSGPHAALPSTPNPEESLTTTPTSTLQTLTSEHSTNSCSSSNISVTTTPSTTETQQPQLREGQHPIQHSVSITQLTVPTQTEWKKHLCEVCVRKNSLAKTGHFTKEEGTIHYTTETTTIDMKPQEAKPLPVSTTTATSTQNQSTGGGNDELAALLQGGALVGGATAFPGMNGLLGTCIHGVHYPWCAFIVGVNKLVFRGLPITVQQLRTRKLLPLHNTMVKPNMAIIGNHALANVLCVLEIHGFLKGVDGTRWTPTTEWNSLQQRAKSEFDEWSIAQRTRRNSGNTPISPTEEGPSSAPASSTPAPVAPTTQANSSTPANPTPPVNSTPPTGTGVPEVVGKFDDHGVTYWRIKYENNVHSVSLPIAARIHLLEVITNYESTLAAVAAATATVRRKACSRRPRIIQTEPQQAVSPVAHRHISQKEQQFEFDINSVKAEKAGSLDPNAQSSDNTDTEDEGTVPLNPKSASVPPAPPKSPVPQLPRPLVADNGEQGYDDGDESDPDDGGYADTFANSEDDYCPPTPKKRRGKGTGLPRGGSRVVPKGGL